MVASRQNVTDYLVNKYDITKSDAEAAVKANGTMIDEQSQAGAYAYWPGDKIANQMGLKPNTGACGVSDEDLDAAEEAFLEHGANEDNE